MSNLYKLVTESLKSGRLKLIGCCLWIEKARSIEKFAFEVDLITAPLKRVDIKPALESFPGVREDEIFRPIGPVDILIGIQSAAIHPTTIEVDGNLRLLKTIFSMGKLVDGYSDSIHSKPVFMEKESFA